VRTRSLALVLLAGIALASTACGHRQSTTGTSGSGGSSGTGGSGTGTTTTTTTMGSGGSGPVACPSGGTETPALTMCTTPDTKLVTVPQGCAPTVDGVIHDVEWKDGACFNVIGGAGMVVVVKYAGDSLYMATSGPPACSCGMQFYFLPLGGQNFGVTVLDTPVGTDGDRTDFTLAGTGLVPAAKDPAIVTACPGNMPNPVRYEWKIALARLGVVANSPGQFQMAITHAGTDWPTALKVDAAMHAVFENGEPTWGALTSPNWP
jgi:hypothetical protein